MADIVNLTGTGVQAFTKQDLDTLKQVLADQHGLSLGTGEEPSPYGAEVIEVPWRVPETITDGMIAAAIDRRAKIAEALAPAGADRMRKWLSQLGILTASGNAPPGDEAMVRIEALCAVFDDAPSQAITKAGLKRAVTKFRFFPTAQELGQFLDAEGRPLKAEADRLHAIIMTGPRQAPPKWSKALSEEYTAKLRRDKDEERRTLAQMIKQQDASR